MDKNKVGRKGTRLSGETDKAAATTNVAMSLEVGRRMKDEKDVKCRSETASVSPKKIP
jgi:hypothetical protein